MDKYCRHCNTTHPLTSEHWFKVTEAPMCKIKYSKQRKEYYSKNKEKELAQHKVYLAKNKDKMLAYQKEYRLKNKAQRNIKDRQRKLVDASYRIACNLRSRLTKVTKEKYGVSSIRNLGCSVEQFKEYLQSKFEVGMTWENYGQWHIDHIFPLSKADLTQKEELLRVCHYSNLQPMWATENIKKGNKIKCL